MVFLFIDYPWSVIDQGFWLKVEGRVHPILHRFLGIRLISILS